MKCPVHLQSPEGVQEWQSIYSKYIFSKANNLFTWFKNYCIIESVVVEKTLLDHIRKYEYDFEDSEATLVAYKKLADKQALYSYFSKIYS